MMKKIRFSIMWLLLISQSVFAGHSDEEEDMDEGLFVTASKESDSKAEQAPKTRELDDKVEQKHKRRKIISRQQYQADPAPADLETKFMSEEIPFTEDDIVRVRVALNEFNERVKKIKESKENVINVEKTLLSFKHVKYFDHNSINDFINFLKIYNLLDMFHAKNIYDESLHIGFINFCCFFIELNKELRDMFTNIIKNNTTLIGKKRIRKLIHSGCYEFPLNANFRKELHDFLSKNLGCSNILISMVETKGNNETEYLALLRCYSGLYKIKKNIVKKIQNIKSIEEIFYIKGILIEKDLFNVSDENYNNIKEKFLKFLEKIFRSEKLIQFAQINTLDKLFPILFYVFSNNEILYKDLMKFFENEDIKFDDLIDFIASKCNPFVYLVEGIEPPKELDLIWNKNTVSFYLHALDTAITVDSVEIIEIDEKKLDYKEFNNDFLLTLGDESDFSLQIKNGYRFISVIEKICSKLTEDKKNKFLEVLENYLTNRLKLNLSYTCDVLSADCSAEFIFKKMDAKILNIEHAKARLVQEEKRLNEIRARNKEKREKNAAQLKKLPIPMFVINQRIVPQAGPIFPKVDEEHLPLKQAQIGLVMPVQAAPVQQKEVERTASPLGMKLDQNFEKWLHNTMKILQSEDKDKAFNVVISNIIKTLNENLFINKTELNDYREKLNEAIKNNPVDVIEIASNLILDFLSFKIIIPELMSLSYNSPQLINELKQILFLYDDIEGSEKRREYVLTAFADSTILSCYQKSTILPMAIEDAVDYSDLAAQLIHYREMLSQHLDKGIVFEDMTNYLTCMIYLSKYNIFASYLAHFMGRETSDFIYNLKKILPEGLLEKDPYIKDNMNFIFHPKLDAAYVHVEERFIHIALAFERAYSTIFKISDKSSNLCPILLKMLHIRIKDLVCFEAKKEAIDKFTDDISLLIELEERDGIISDSVKPEQFIKKLHAQFNILKDVHVYGDAVCVKRKAMSERIMKFQEMYKNVPFNHPNVAFAAFGNPDKKVKTVFMNMPPEEFNFMFSLLKEYISTKEESILLNKLTNILKTLIDLNKDVLIEGEGKVNCFIVATIFKYLYDGGILDKNQFQLILTELIEEKIIDKEDVQLVHVILNAYVDSE